MTLISRIRSGWRPTLADKIMATDSLLELEALMSTREFYGPYPTTKETALASKRRAQLAEETQR